MHHEDVIRSQRQSDIDGDYRRYAARWERRPLPCKWIPIVVQRPIYAADNMLCPSRTERPILLVHKTISIFAFLSAPVLIGGFSIFPPSANAQEFSFLGGPLVSSSANSYSWDAGYREGLGRYAAWSFSWVNEGHLPGHHRDGPALQGWGRLPILNDRLELSAGAGPYRYFDTTAAQAGGDYSNTHGWGALWSVRAAWYFDRRWIAQMQLNHAQVFGGQTPGRGVRTGWERRARPTTTAHLAHDKRHKKRSHCDAWRDDPEQQWFGIGLRRKRGIQAGLIAVRRRDRFIHS
jgi:hypothetical protein